MQRSFSAVFEPSWQAVVEWRRPLLYSEGGDATVDRPAHVRAGSGLAWVGDHLALVRDDASFIALIPSDDLHGNAAPRVRAIALPAGPGGRRQFDDIRGNKGDKLDLEACVAISGEDGDTLLAFGSGSKSQRERVILVDGVATRTPRVQVVDASPLYAALRRDAAFAGSDMNIEGAMLHGQSLRFFGRGNGAPRDGDLARNSTCDVDVHALLAFLRGRADAGVPALRDTTQYHLGTLRDVALGFTDATRRDDHALYVAAAEDSPDATRDGVVTGSVIGLLPLAGGPARQTTIVAPDGQRFAEKVEGVALHQRDRSRAYVIIDSDDPARASELCGVRLSGAWGA